MARLHGGTDAGYRGELVRRFQVDLNRKVRALSKGNRQKVQLVAALATRADLLLLDEPTSGLDPLMEMAFRESIEEAKERGQTVFLGVAALLYAVIPCASAGLAYGAVVVAFLWQLFGSLVGAPRWLVDATPFVHIGFVPAQAFKVGPAVVMALVGVACAGLSLLAFCRRDLLGA